jgi:uncharacterized protein YbaP (TraB family)
VTTIPSGTITAPTRRELLMSLGTLAIGIATGAARSAPHSDWPIWSVESAGGQGYLVGETYPRPEKGPAMVVLGHFHLVGSDGVLAQLEAAGMTFRRI